MNPVGIVNGAPPAPAAQPPYSLTKELTGTLILASADSYGGAGSTFSDSLDTNPPGDFPMGTLVAQGTLVVTNDDGLGADGNTTTVLDGAQLQIQSTTNTVQTLTVPITDTNTFTLSFNGSTTAPITLTGDPTTDAAAIQAALNSPNMTSIASVGAQVSVVEQYRWGYQRFLHRNVPWSAGNRYAAVVDRDRP